MTKRKKARREKALTDLLTKVEAEKFSEMTYEILENARLVYFRSSIEDAYNGSLSAALALHEMFLPTGRFSWKLRVDRNGVATAVIDGADWATPECTARTAARAWLIAILRAMIVLEGLGE